MLYLTELIGPNPRSTVIASRVAGTNCMISTRPSLYDLSTCCPWALLEVGMIRSKVDRTKRVMPISLVHLPREDICKIAPVSVCNPEAPPGSEPLRIHRFSKAVIKSISVTKTHVDKRYLLAARPKAEHRSPLEAPLSRDRDAVYKSLSSCPCEIHLKRAITATDLKKPSFLHLNTDSDGQTPTINPLLIDTMSPLQTAIILAISTLVSSAPTPTAIIGDPVFNMGVTNCNVTGFISEFNSVNFGPDGSAGSTDLSAGLNVNCAGQYTAAWHTDDLPNSQTISSSKTGLPGDIVWTKKSDISGSMTCSASYDGGEVVQGTPGNDISAGFGTSSNSNSCEVAFEFTSPDNS